MHYYKRNLGDYAKKAGRLSMLEHGAYTLLLDACYDRERFPTEDEAIEWAWARTECEIAAVKFVLARFFTLTDGVYVQERIAEEVGVYQRNADNNARIAKEREEKRKAAARSVHGACESGDEAPPNHKPLTNNQEPGTSNTSSLRSEVKPARAARKPAKTNMPPGFSVSDRVKTWASEHGHGQLQEHLEYFKTKAQANGYAYVDWDAAFMSAIRDNWAKVGVAQARASPPYAMINRQEAQEARNRAVADEWLRQQGVSDGCSGQGEILEADH